MHQRLAATIGAIVSIGLFVLTNAKRLADAISIIHLPNDVEELLTSMSHTPTLISYGALAIGIICLAYLAISHWWPTAERPDPAVEAQRQHTAAILAQTEALKIGPPALAGVEEPKNVAFDPSWVRDVELWESLWRAYSGNWNGRSDVETGVEILRFEIAADTIRQHAFEGSLPIWGRRPKSNLYELIPRAFWRNHEIFISYILNSTGRDLWVDTTHALAVGDVPHSRAREWVGFMTCKEAVEKLWP
jgi:hypothetical protein